MKKMTDYPVNKYDARHDVLHMFLDTPYNAFFDEEARGIYVNRDEESNEIVGFTVLDYSRKREIVKRKYPQFDFPSVSLR